MRLLQEMRKDVLSLVRSPAAIVTLVLGPLILLLLVGFTLSGTELHGIRIGVTGPGASAMTLNATVEKFGSADGCVAALRGQFVHICLEFRQFGTEGGVPQGTVIFHIDESRQRISSMVLHGISEQLGIESSRIRVEAVQGLLDEFGKIAAFMSQKRTDLVSLRQEALSLRSDVGRRRARLDGQAAVFRGIYHPLRGTLQNTSLSLGAAGGALADAVNATAAAVDALAAEGLLADVTDNTTMALRQRLDAINADLTAARQDSENLSLTAASLVEQLDGIDRQFDEDMAATKDYEEKIDIGVANIDTAIVRLDADIQKLSSLDPSLAKRIDMPIVQEVRTLFDRLRPIEAGFAQLFVIVVVFISMLFGAIVTLMEINSRAVLRNTLTPTGETETLVALCLTSLLVVGIQAAVLLVVAQTMLAIDVGAALGSLALVGTVVALIFILLGMAIALRLRKQQSTILVATFGALIILFFSDVMTSVELMPPTVASIVRYNPLIAASDTLKQTLLFSQPLAMDALLPLLVWLGITLLLVVLAYRAYKARIARW